ncbi:MAG: hypothetical protein JWQ51_2768 [Tardiphaga sp.]|nr:hypothetical protein [Tardiphaga sp.]
MTDEKLKSRCDAAVTSAALLMHTDGASLSMILDRLLTYSLAQMCAVDGSPKTAANLRIMADKIDRGAFHRVTGENHANNGVRH